MKSSTGKYFVGLDHIRALAAFMVFAWHFIHINDNHIAPASIVPFPLLTEGHTGVALFMTLSGYLFAKLLDGKDINYPSFIWNRALRLLPLLTLVIVIVGVQNYFGDGKTLPYLKRILYGFVKPGWPNGGWSITVELHFYLILPLLLFFSTRFKYALLGFILLAVAFRYMLYLELGQIQTLAYPTIIGRVDQFILGIAAYQHRDLLKNRHLLAVAVVAAFSIFYWYFESRGGFYEYPRYPSPSRIWIFLTTIEGLSYGILIAWYDNSFTHSSGRFSRFIALIGTYSYSIYLLHFFFFRQLSALIDRYIFELSNVYYALLFAPLGFFDDDSPGVHKLPFH